MDSSDTMAHARDDIEEPVEVTSSDRDAGLVRIAHIRTEKNVRTIGWVCVLGGGLGVIRSLQHLSMDPQALFISLGVAVAFFFSGVWLLRLDARGRLLYTGTLAVKLAVLAFDTPAALDQLDRARGTSSASSEILYSYLVVFAIFSLALSALFLCILWSRKGRTVTSERYRKTIIPRALDVTYHSRAWLLFAILIAAVLAASAFMVAAGRTPSAPGARPFDISADRETDTRAPVVDTSHDELLARKHAAGDRIRFDAIILVDTFIQTNVNGAIAYFALAVKKDSTYFDELRAVADELRQFQKALRTPRLASQPKRLIKVVEQYRRIVSRVKGTHPAPEDFIAIELAGALQSMGNGEWESVIDDRRGLFERWLDRDMSTPLSLPSMRYASIESATWRVQALLRKQPPNLAEEMPDLESIWVNRFDGSEVRRYNQLVNLYNKEVSRRRPYMVQRMDEQVMVVLTTIDDQLSAEAQVVSARVMTEPVLASRTFRKLYGDAPAVYLAEEHGPDTVMKRLDARRHVLITSYPTGAAISIDGQNAGKTPHLVRGLRAGTTLALVLDKRGYATVETQLEVMSGALHVQPFEGVLEKTAQGKKPRTKAVKRTVRAEAFAVDKNHESAKLGSHESPNLLDHGADTIDRVLGNL